MVWIGDSDILGESLAGVFPRLQSTNQNHQPNFENQCLGIGCFLNCFAGHQISLEMAVVVGWLDSAKHCSPRNLLPPMGA